MDENKNEYVTSEFPLAVALICMKVQLLGLRKKEGDEQRAEFVFGKDELIEKLIAGYWSSSLLVEPKAFWNHSRELKSRINEVAN